MHLHWKTAPKLFLRALREGLSKHILEAAINSLWNQGIVFLSVHIMDTMQTYYCKSVVVFLPRANHGHDFTSLVQTNLPLLVFFTSTQYKLTASKQQAVTFFSRGNHVNNWNHFFQTRLSLLICCIIQDIYAYNNIRKEDPKSNVAKIFLIVSSEQAGARNWAVKYMPTAPAHAWMRVLVCCVNASPCVHVFARTRWYVPYTKRDFEVEHSHIVNIDAHARFIFVSYMMPQWRGLRVCARDRPSCARKWPSVLRTCDTSTLSFFGFNVGISFVPTSPH